MSPGVMLCWCCFTCKSDNKLRLRKGKEALKISKGFSKEYTLRVFFTSIPQQPKYNCYLYASLNVTSKRLGSPDYEQRIVKGRQDVKVFGNWPLLFFPPPSPYSYSKTNKHLFVFKRSQSYKINLVLTFKKDKITYTIIDGTLIQLAT